MTRLLPLTVLGVLAFAAPAVAADKDMIAHGKMVFDNWCAPCHAPGPRHPGTQALAALYKGEKPDALENRTDLTPEIVSTFVRTGVSVMPFFRKTEVSDDDLAALGAYLSRKLTN